MVPKKNKKSKLPYTRRGEPDVGLQEPDPLRKYQYLNMIYYIVWWCRRGREAGAEWREKKGGRRIAVWRFGDTLEPEKGAWVGAGVGNGAGVQRAQSVW